jgi:hypothetical protein
MSDSNIKSLAFRADYDRLVRALRTKVTLFAVSAPAPNKIVVVNAIWDTGATNSVITPSVAKFLNLAPIDYVNLFGVNSEKPESRPVSIVHIGLPNNVLVQNQRVSIANIAGTDMLIGMNIITLGDFLICNSGKKTSLSFVIPPFPDKPDWLEMSNKINQA